MSGRISNRNKWLHVRVSMEEYNNITQKVSKTFCRKRSDYLRKLMLSQPVVFKYRNQSLDDFMEQMIILRNELHAIGTNFNQAVKKLNMLSKISDFRDWLKSYENDRHLLLDKIEEIKNRINSLSDEWLQ